MAKGVAAVSGYADVYPRGSVVQSGGLTASVGQGAAAGGFATSAAADFLETLGWDVAPGPRRDSPCHDALACCMILRDGRQEEAAFGFDEVTLPDARGHPRLRAAFACVEGVLARLGERRGVLLAHRPLVAAAPGGADTFAVFGGWRFDAGGWQPLLIAPGGLGAVAAQSALFGTGTLPAHMAVIAGQPADKVRPALERWGQAAAVLEGLDVTGESWTLAPFAGGWSCLVPTAAAQAPVVPMPTFSASGRRGPRTAMPQKSAYWDAAEDEFRFRAVAADRP